MSIIFSYCPSQFSGHFFNVAEVKSLISCTISCVGTDQMEVWLLLIDFYTSCFREGFFIVVEQKKAESESSI